MLINSKIISLKQPSIMVSFPKRSCCQRKLFENGHRLEICARLGFKHVRKRRQGSLRFLPNKSTKDTCITITIYGIPSTLGFESSRNGNQISELSLLEVALYKVVSCHLPPRQCLGCAGCKILTNCSYDLRLKLLSKDICIARINSNNQVVG